MPILAKYYIENHKIEVVKTFFGKEKVLLNGTAVSEHSSNSSSEHQFKIGKNRFKISKRNGQDAEKMNTFEIRKNGSPIALINIESQTSSQMFLLIIVVGLGCGFLIGVLLYNIF
jgi:hypothetical protein